MAKKEETLQVLTEIINESHKIMLSKAQKLADCKEWEFDAFADRNTFARLMFEVLCDEEKSQYQAINNTQTAKEIRKELKYEIGFIR